MCHGKPFRQSFRARRAAELQKLKESSPCTDCGRYYPSYVMQFDHVSGDKKFNISKASRGFTSTARLEAELAKCELVCANCHAIRGHDRAQQLSFRYPRPKVPTNGQVAPKVA